MTALEWALGVVFAAWLLVTIRFHVPLEGQQPLRRFDPLGLVPDWRFFAPHPPQFDYALLYRDHLPGGIVTPWTDVRIVESRRPWNAVWNPDRRTRKAFFDLTTDMALHQAQVRTEDMHLTVPYLMLLNHVSALPRTVPATGTQFAVMVVPPAADQDADMLFLSNVHEV
jgi:hypothetical protein